MFISIDAFIEVIFGRNLVGFGRIEINGVPQPNGTRIVSFFKDEPVAGAFIYGFWYVRCFPNDMLGLSSHPLV